MMFTSDTKEKVFSCLSGYNFYTIMEKFTDETGRQKSKAVHDLNGTDVEVRYDSKLSGQKDMQKWKYFIEHPIDISNILWPIDIIRNDDEELGIVFRRRSFPPLKPLKILLYNEEKLDWRSPEIQKLILNILKLCQNIHEGGYAYHCFDIERMWFDPKNMNVVFDFSLSMARTYHNAQREEKTDYVDVGIEFLPIWHELLAENHMTLEDDYYSITTMLFRLMIGRMPYQGRLMDGNGDMMNLLRDVDANAHVNMFRKYREQPVFIFDESDTRNAIGIFLEEEEYIERWNSLPENVKKMFYEVLKGQNVKKDLKDRVSYSPAKWLEVLTSVFSMTKGDVA